ncbi:MAG: ABC transporter ATP-binding protein [Thermodesulfobacteriota bacterium]
MTDRILEINNLEVGFETKKGLLKAVDGVSLWVKKGESLGIVGESGCGKTVTALSILQVLPPQGRIIRGSILFNGKSLLEMGKEEMRHFRGGQISIIFQEPMISLNPVLTIERQLGEMMRIHKGLDRTTARQRVLELLESVGIPDPERVAAGYPHEISGGMQQRVMIAMALAGDPKLVIADEPTTALDVTIEVQILDLIRELQHRLGMSLIYISHDLGIIAEMTDRVAVMYAGRVMEYTETSTLFAEAKHPYTLGLMASVPDALSGNMRRKEMLKTIPGTVPHMGELPSGCKFSNRCDYVFERCHGQEPGLSGIGEEGHLVRCYLYQNG